MASNDQLTDWNRRIRRLARDYPPKYRPVVLSIGYHVNLDEGLSRAYVGVKTIISDSARYTASGKPLQDRYVKRLLAEMIKAGAVKAEDRQNENTGRQTSSYRTLNTAISMDRNGFTRKHDFQAPFAQADEKKDTPQDTPQDTRTVFDLALDMATNCPSSPEPGSARGGGDGASDQDQDQDQDQEPRSVYQFSQSEKDDLARNLGVTVESIRPPFWAWYGRFTDQLWDSAHENCRCGCESDCTHEDDCSCPCPTSGSAEECTCQCEHDAGFADDVLRTFVAAGLAAGKRNPVGYFQETVESYIETQHAKRASRAA